MEKAREIGSARLVFRFVVGGSELATEWLGAALRAIEQQPTPADATPEAVPLNARAVALGALSAALRWRPPVARLGAASRSTALATRRGLRLLARVPGAGLVRRRYGGLRAGAAAQVHRWAEEGAREQLAGRRLARLATPGFVELAMARMSESPELRTVIEEQSEGLAAHSMAELRERSHDADRAVERFVRRVFRRPQNGAPGRVARRAQVTTVNAPSQHAGSERAGFVSRAAAVVVDAVILAVMIRGTVWLVDGFDRALGQLAPPVDLGRLVFACAPLVIVGYLLGFWTTLGQTPGKWILGLKVVPLGGGKLTFRRSVVRLVGYVLSAVPFYLGFAWVLGPQRRAWHDRFARTEVTYVSPPRETRAPTELRRRMHPAR